tara:strand:+ start:380 stop:628 length:249 start_codon:yes stop_codon:yes gene_type:complete
MSMIYDKFTSSAIKSVETLDNTVKVVYNSNINKEYVFKCEELQQFVDKLSETLIAHEELLEGGSVGKFINQSIRSGVLVESK